MNVFNLDVLDIESFQAGFAEIIKDRDGMAMGRLSDEIQHAVTHDGSNHGLRLSLSARGRPAGQSINTAFEFMSRYRNEIVVRFDRITTKNAQSEWQRALT
ncbi:MAG: hypothetical protein OXC91_11545 [Rhodobacteraceae bacterium]|nr:hypothetical protein [Paracoccaceae bacterium]